MCIFCGEKILHWDWRMKDHLHRLVISSSANLILEAGAWRFSESRPGDLLNFCILHRGFSALGYSPDIDFSYLKDYAYSSATKARLDGLIQNPKLYPLYKVLIKALKDKKVPKDPLGSESKGSKFVDNFEHGDTLQSKLHKYFCPTGM